MLTGKLNPNYRHGKYCKEYYCVGCLEKGIIKKLSKNHITKYSRCRSCTQKYIRKLGLINSKGIKHWNWRGGFPKCIEPNCGKLLKNRKAKRCHSCEAKRRVKLGIFVSKGKNNPMFGKKHSDDTKKEMSLIKGGTGIPYENNKYPEEFFKKRYKILKKYNYICQKCFKSGNEVHHIDYNKLNNKENNLIVLCHSCNVKVNRNRKYWKEFFRKLINKKNRII